MIGRRSIAVALAALAVGCTVSRSELMSSAPDQPSHLRPASGKALVLFLRPESRGGNVSAVVYDGTEFLGVSSVGWAIACQAEPGPHRFMVISEAADFMDADLVAGRIYYAQVRPRMGAWRARFSLQPLSIRTDARDIEGWVAQSQLAIPNDAGRQWAERNRPSVLEKKAAWEPKWLEKPDRPVLHADDGQ